MKNNDIVSIENLHYKSNTLNVSWLVTHLCNYRCKMCIQGDYKKHLENAKGESAEKRRKISDEILNFVNGSIEYKNIKVGFIGGEVTILKDFPEILSKLVKSDFQGKLSFHITTNFSQTASYYINLCDIIRRANQNGAKRCFSMLASYYSSYVSDREYCHKMDQILDYLDKHNNEKDPSSAQIVIKAGFPILTGLDFMRYKKIKSEYANKPLDVNPIVIRQYDINLPEKIYNELYREETEVENVRVTDCDGNVIMYRNIQAIGAFLEDSDRFCPQGYICDAGINSLRVDPFGNVKRCPSMDKSVYNLGNLLDGSFQKIKEPMLCSSDHCSCNYYGTITRAY